MEHFIAEKYSHNRGGRRGRNHMVVPMQSVPTITKVVSSNPNYGEVYSIQHFVIKFVSDLRQVGGILQVLQFPPPIKLTTTIYLKIVESGVKQHKSNPQTMELACYGVSCQCLTR